MAATSIPDLVDLIASSAASNVYPSDDHILTTIQARLRADHPYTRIGAKTLLAINPFRSLSHLNDASAEEYINLCYDDADWHSKGVQYDPNHVLPPHPYEFALRAYHAMRRKSSSQAIVFTGSSNSGKSFTSNLITNQLLRLASRSTEEEAILADRCQAMERVLTSFGSAKTHQNNNASRTGQYKELHFNNRGRLQSAKVLTFGLEKQRVCASLARDERTFHVFYQLLAGASSEERDVLRLEDITSYNLLRSSGCYRLTGGPSSDDSIAMEELRVAMRTLGFKTRQIQAIWSILSAVLLLNNIEFSEPYLSDGEDVEGATISNPHVLHDASLLLGVEANDLQECLTSRTRFINKDTVTSILSFEGARAQRDAVVRDLYATLFAFVIETANHRLSTTKEEERTTCIVQLDIPGFQQAAQGNLSSHGIFAFNFMAEMVQHWVSRQIFDDSCVSTSEMLLDGVQLNEVTVNDNSSCIELIRGTCSIEPNCAANSEPAGLLGALRETVEGVAEGEILENDHFALLQRLDRSAHHALYSASLKHDRKAFAVQHYQDTCTYDPASFIRDEQDRFDVLAVQILQQSQVPFVAKLFSGPSLSQEKHPMDFHVTVDAQVSVRPLRLPAKPNATYSTAELSLDVHRPYGVLQQLNDTMSTLLANMQEAEAIWTILTIRPNDIDQPNAFEANCVKKQIRAMHVPEITLRKRIEFFTGMEYEDACIRYAACGLVQAAIAAGVDQPSEKMYAFAIANAWRDGVDFAMGNEKIWLSYERWRALEDRLRIDEPDQRLHTVTRLRSRLSSAQSLGSNAYWSAGSKGLQSPSVGEWDELLENPKQDPFADTNPAAMVEEHDDHLYQYQNQTVPPIDMLGKENTMMEAEKMNTIEEVPITRVRRWWVRFTWFFTCCIPSKLLSSCGGMKRPDVQMAWREKVTICSLIFLACALILFNTIAVGHLVCPNMNKAWNADQLSGFNRPDAYYVAVRGTVYDLTKFWRLQHSDSSSQSSPDIMMQLGGLDLTPYFPIPLTIGCPFLVTDTQLYLQTNASSFYYSAQISQAVHRSGPLGDPASKLSDINWYPDRFLKYVNQYRKGFFVTSRKDVAKMAGDRQRAIIDGKVYDLGDYLNTLSLESNVAAIKFLPDSISNLFAGEPGMDISQSYHQAMATFNTTMQDAVQTCLDNVFYDGLVDFRETARCQTQNYLLLSFSIILGLTIVAKFLAALQLAPKRNPEQLDKFVICQVPCYTEGEDELRKTIDSLAALQYDDKRKLLFIICDGTIIGNGNEQPTPKIVLDILGVDPKAEVEPLMFKSIAEGSKQLNYGKVYSGLYEFEGHVVPYVVVVKVGRPSERSRPGNRGKRDTQILLMRYLNRVHFDSPMYPLELEIYHHMKNVIGIDPAFYEYILMVDADTTVHPEGLNRLVAVAADDSKVIAVCGETKLFNEEGSWWTMIQVYEYYISHHLSKAFESLFGSVTCLPGCFSMYRIRSADKGHPLIISNRVIDDYSENRIDTLHKKNLLSLGEDRYLTTLILKHFPAFSTKFTSDAKAQTTAPDRWGILLSQRRRWINSTVHNLAELLLMPELCGFCFFSMRFIVFVDLLGTIILPATTVYMAYLIVMVSTGKSPFPYISLAILGAVYGLQMLIFLLKRQWQYLGWLVIYLIAYPIWSFFLPIYSFWHMDDFSWGNTRIVVGEKGNKKIVAGTDDEPYDDRMVPLKKVSEWQKEGQMQNALQGNTNDAVSFVTQTASNLPASKSQAPFIPASSSFAAHSQAGSVFGASPGSDTDTRRDRQTFAMGSLPQSRNSSAHGDFGVRASQHSMMALNQPFMGHMGGQTPYGGYMTPAMSMYGLPPAPMPSMYGMPPMMSSMYASPAGSVVGFQGGMGQSYFPSPGSDIGPSTATQKAATGSTPRYSAGNMLMNAGSSLRSEQQNNQRPPGPRSASTIDSRANPFHSDSSSDGVQQANTGSILPINPKADPTEEDISSAVRTFLAGQPDLMRVSKRDVREAIVAAFPNAPLMAVSKGKINRAVDDTLASIS
ncbi:uncharacterized protein FA14DRAFT_189370 [Meira miltonrushii]|uniref:chitin synthase n=1 Tax=Meira miltonrushii TaxID=1280837 RepID=A0A316VCW3_9BASI|nr:uncharacterized protein FA14DRAFT_189370 [Meira miltonrushii]PWN35402.1 hypothetical protein FA14DRAFT_189370 [Meira miltonrushii]